jgi:hypothetical protein
LSEQLLRRAYEAFNRRDIDAALAHMHPDVDWPNAIEGRREHGHDAVRRYWAGQFREIDPHVEPRGFTTDSADRVVVDVHQLVRDNDGNLLADQQVQHVYSIRDGLIERMEIRETASASAP